MWNQLLLSGRNASGFFLGMASIYHSIYILVKTISQVMFCAILALMHFTSLTAFFRVFPFEISRIEIWRIN